VIKMSKKLSELLIKAMDMLISKIYPKIKTDKFPIHSYVRFYPDRLVIRCGEGNKLLWEKKFEKVIIDDVNYDEDDEVKIDFEIHKYDGECFEFCKFVEEVIDNGRENERRCRG